MPANRLRIKCLARVVLRTSISAKAKLIATMAQSWLAFSRPTFELEAISTGTEAASKMKKAFRASSLGCVLAGRLDGLHRFICASRSLSAMFNVPLGRMQPSIAGIICGEKDRLMPAIRRADEISWSICGEIDGGGSQRNTSRCSDLYVFFISSGETGFQRNRLRFSLFFLTWGHFRAAPKARMQNRRKWHAGGGASGNRLQVGWDFR